jgi:plasmid stability protein
MQGKPGTLTVMVREIDRAIWRRARVRAIREGRGMSELIRAFVRQYGAGKIDVPREPKRTGRKH